MEHNLFVLLHIVPDFFKGMIKLTLLGSMSGVGLVVLAPHFHVLRYSLTSGVLTDSSFPVKGQYCSKLPMSFREAWNYHRCWTTIKEFCPKNKTKICLKSLLHQVSRRRTSGRDCPEGMVLHHWALGHGTAACLSCPWQDRRNLLEIKASPVQRSSVKLEFIVVAKAEIASIWNYSRLLYPWLTSRWSGWPFTSPGMWKYMCF